MKTQLICLANSYKEGGRCLAGIALQENGNPILKNGIPLWIRPVCKTKWGEVPTFLAKNIALLDILEFELTEAAPEKFQVENYLFDTKSLATKGVYDKNLLRDLCDKDRHFLFGNKTKALSETEAQDLDHSLTMICVKRPRIVEKTYGDPDKIQLRLIFDFNNNLYDLPITDPVFVNKYRYNKQLLNEFSEYCLVVSLGILHEGHHYKLVAAVIGL